MEYPSSLPRTTSDDPLLDKPMKVACISASRVPSTTANSIQLMKACQAISQLGTRSPSVSAQAQASTQ